MGHSIHAFVCDQHSLDLTDSLPLLFTVVNFLRYSYSIDKTSLVETWLNDVAIYHYILNLHTKYWIRGTLCCRITY